MGSSTWRDEAACRGLGDIMFITGDVDTPARRARISRAVAVCHQCPVLDDCHQWTEQLTERLVAVVVAGRFESQRRARAIRHGTVAGYATHLRRGEVACSDCRAVRAAYEYDRRRARKEAS
jgi:hypothetical protein